MTARYIPATIPTDMHGTVIALLLTAADIVATEPTDTDAVALAAIRTHATGQPHRTAARIATDTAGSRCPTALPAGAASHQWATWQTALTEPWPILADAAARFYGPDDAAAGITPGRWQTHT